QVVDDVLITFQGGSVLFQSVGVPDPDVPVAAAGPQETHPAPLMGGQAPDGEPVVGKVLHQFAGGRLPHADPAVGAPAGQQVAVRGRQGHQGPDGQVVALHRCAGPPPRPGVDAHDAVVGQGGGQQEP